MTPDPLILHPANNLAVLPQRAKAGEDRLGLGVRLVAPISAGHKVARAAIAKRAAVVKFDQFIGEATADIGLGEYVHVANCSFANPEQIFAISADLTQARRQFRSATR